MRAHALGVMHHRWHSGRQASSADWQNALRCADNLAICSCWMCGNARRTFGEVTRREIIHDSLRKYEPDEFSY
jgi:hypothetical protein